MPARYRYNTASTNNLLFLAVAPGHPLYQVKGVRSVPTGRLASHSVSYHALLIVIAG